jgi:hypothetical protein
LSGEEKPGPTAPPAAGVGEADEDKSPSLEELDSAWSDEEEYDEEATRVAKIPLDLVALSRRGPELEAKGKPAPEKHEAITARPPPPGAGEASVVVDVPHETLPNTLSKIEPEAAAAGTDLDGPDDDDDLEADDLDAGWDIEEEKAVAADLAAGLDAEARKKAAEERAAHRKEKARAKKLAAKEKRKAHAESIRLKQKKPKKRSNPPPRDSAAVRAAANAKAPTEAVKAREATSRTSSSSSPPKKDARPDAGARPAAGERPGAVARPAAARALARRDMTRMIFFVAIVVVIGALVIGLSRR